MKPKRLLIGDFVKSVTQLVGLETCGNCEKRRVAMNAWQLKMMEKLGPRPSEEKADADQATGGTVGK